MPFTPPFTPPGFITLRTNTSNLFIVFSKHAGLYQVPEKIQASILPAPLTSPIFPAAQPVSTLQLLLARVSESLLNSNSARIDHRDFFVDLQKELLPYINDEAMINNCTMLLLGALFYSYFIILKEYADSNVKYYFFKPNKPENCQFFSAIRTVLDLTPPTQNYKIRDLERLDTSTVTACLEVFQTYLLTPDKNNVPKYRTIKYFMADPKFEANLSQMIKSQEARDPIQVKQYYAVCFLQSLAKKLNEEHDLVKDAISKWSAQLIKDHASFGELGIDKIELHIDKYYAQNVILRDAVKAAFNVENVHTKLATFTQEQFVETLLKNNSDIYAYILFGGYVVLLESPDLDDKLKFCLHKALEVETRVSEMSSKIMSYGIRVLNQYIEDNPSLIVNCKFFGGKNEMITKVSQTNQNLLTRVAKESPTTNIAEALTI